MNPFGACRPPGCGGPETADVVVQNCLFLFLFFTLKRYFFFVNGVPFPVGLIWFTFYVHTSFYSYSRVDPIDTKVQVQLTTSALLEFIFFKSRKKKDSEDFEFGLRPSLVGAFRVLISIGYVTKRKGGRVWQNDSFMHKALTVPQYIVTKKAN